MFNVVLKTFNFVVLLVNLLFIILLLISDAVFEVSSLLLNFCDSDLQCFVLVLQIWIILHLSPVRVDDRVMDGGNILCRRHWRCLVRVGGSRLLLLSDLWLISRLTNGTVSNRWVVFFSSILTWTRHINNIYECGLLLMVRIPHVDRRFIEGSQWRSRHANTFSLWVGLSLSGQVCLWNVRLLLSNCRVKLGSIRRKSLWWSTRLFITIAVNWVSVHHFPWSSSCFLKSLLSAFIIGCVSWTIEIERLYIPTSGHKALSVTLSQRHLLVVDIVCTSESWSSSWVRKLVFFSFYWRCAVTVILGIWWLSSFFLIDIALRWLPHTGNGCLSGFRNVVSVEFLLIFHMNFKFVN